jgi:citrate lyase beta subunit
MTDANRLSEVITRAQAGRAAVLRERERNRVELPLRYWRQQAHFTTPASNLALATKAVEGGLAPALRLFEKFDIGRAELAETFDLPTAAVSRWLDDAALRPPLVLIDGEDAQALRADVVERGRANAVKIFREASWSPATLRFYRPSGIELEFCIDDLVTVLTRAGEGRATYPIDGIIWPKVEQPSELEWLQEILLGVERAIGLPENHLRLQFLIESGWALAELPALVKAAGPRLCGLIFGIADYSADIGLASIHNSHVVADAARIAIVNQAGAAGVPAIDALTLTYPVAEKGLSAAENKARILAALRECFDDTRHGLALGMSGKWVGHPAQLLACLLAFHDALPPRADRGGGAPGGGVSSLRRG